MSRGPDPSKQSSNPPPPAFNPNAVTVQSAPTDAFNTSLQESWTIKGEKRQVAAPAGLAASKGGDFSLGRPLVDIQQNSSVIDLIKALYQMPTADLKALQQRLVEANYLNPKDATSGLSNVTGTMDSNTLKAYESLLTDVYQYQQSNPSKDMTVNDLLNQKIDAYQAGGGNKTTTSTVNLMNPLQAQSFLEGAAEKLLGRLPTAGEVAGFTSALNSYQQANPDLSTTIVNPDGTKATVANKAGITPYHGGDSAANNYLENTMSGDVGQHSQNVAMQSLLSMLGVQALPGMSG